MKLFAECMMSDGAELHSVTLLFDISHPQTTTIYPKYRKLTNAVITFIYHHIIAVYTKPIYRFSTKNKVCNSGILLCNSGIKQVNIC